jgi:hypothetical protein
MVKGDGYLYLNSDLNIQSNPFKCLPTPRWFYLLHPVVQQPHRAINTNDAVLQLQRGLTGLTTPT